MTDLLPAAEGLRQWLTSSRIPLTVRGIANQCWKCGFDDTAVALVHVTDEVGVYSVVPAVKDHPLAYARDLLTLAGHPLAASIRARRSKTEQETYLSNGCSRCDALYGAFGLSEDVAGIRANDAVASLPILVETERPEIEWVLLTAERDGLYDG